jgi:type II secretory pathway component PulF
VALFKYKARNPAGEEQDGTVEATSMEAAIDTLQRNNLILISITPEKGLAFWERPLGSFRTVKIADLVIFTRQLSTLFGAKVPVVQALRTLANESQNENFRIIIVDIVDRVAGGSSLSMALGEHPEVFSSFYINLVRSGEESGKLEDTFDFLAGYLERAEYLASKAKNALIYPAFILFAFILVLIVMFTYVVPRLVSILQETGQALPWYTHIVIFVSSALVNFGSYFLILLIIGGIFLWRFLRTEAGREVWDRFVLTFPIIGGLYRKIYLSRITDNLATLFVGGISILNSLKIASDVVDNSVYKKILLDAAESVRGGNTISASLARFEDIPPLVTQMIKIGEETGKLDFILNKVSAYYRQEVDNILNNLVSLIEPILIISLGIGVAVIVAAIFVPLYGITSSI